ncbi:MAG: 1-acyl-sn-glycerol-3-phosphate acyltransferase [Clostridia bacterium]|nr:1-acyl-sn-glycerol-3-phosphate acyltransferase [Clostridia bacterium]
MRDKQKVIYYTDEKNDDFSGLKIQVRPLGESYRYMRDGRLFRGFEWVFYYGIMIPVVYMLQKVYCHQKFANRKVLRQAKKQGCFIVSNHTQVQSDSYIGPLAAYPKKCFIISNPHVLSVRFMRLGMQAYGVIPLGSNLEEKKAFLHCVETRLNQGKAVIVYPEAHVWPYYTKIRDFDDQCFWYLGKGRNPLFVLTNCYQKRRFFKKPRIVTYADGPFYADPDLTTGAAAKQLRDIAYATMCKRVAEHSTCEYIKYVKKETESSVEK